MLGHYSHTQGQIFGIVMSGSVLGASSLFTLVGKGPATALLPLPRYAKVLQLLSKFAILVMAFPFVLMICGLIFIIFKGHTDV